MAESDGGPSFNGRFLTNEDRKDIERREAREKNRKFQLSQKYDFVIGEEEPVKRLKKKEHCRRKR